MSKYQILYIDEQDDAREIFRDSMSDDTFEVTSMHPITAESEMIDFIANEKYDAVIIDYGLMQNDPKIKYNGGEIINKINEIKEDFPAFILTRTIEQDGGIDERVNSTMILLKGDLNNANQLPIIKRRIEKYIKRYKKENEVLSKEYYDLIQKKNALKDKLESKDLERLNFLDEKIERRMMGKRQFPKLLKDSDNLKHLNALIKDAEDFLQKNNIK